MSVIYVARNKKNGFVFLNSADANETDCKIKALCAKYAQNDIFAMGLERAFDASNLELVPLPIPEWKPSKVSG